MPSLLSRAALVALGAIRGVPGERRLNTVGPCTHDICGRKLITRLHDKGDPKIWTPATCEDNNTPLADWDGTETSCTEAYTYTAAAYTKSTVVLDPNGIFIPQPNNAENKIEISSNQDITVTVPTDGTQYAHSTQNCELVVRSSIITTAGETETTSVTFAQGGSVTSKGGVDYASVSVARTGCVDDDGEVQTDDSKCQCEDGTQPKGQNTCRTKKAGPNDQNQFTVTLPSPTIREESLGYLGVELQVHMECTVGEGGTIPTNLEGKDDDDNDIYKAPFPVVYDLSGNHRYAAVRHKYEEHGSNLLKYDAAIEAMESGYSYASKSHRNLPTSVTGTATLQTQKSTVRFPAGEWGTFGTQNPAHSDHTECRWEYSVALDFANQIKIDNWYKDLRVSGELGAPKQFYYEPKTCSGTPTPCADKTTQSDCETKLGTCATDPDEQELTCGNEGDDQITQADCLSGDACVWEESDEQCAWGQTGIDNTDNDVKGSDCPDETDAAVACGRKHTADLAWTTALGFELPLAHYFKGTCAVTSGGTNTDCAGKTTQIACDAATTSGGDGVDANACVFTAALPKIVCTENTQSARLAATSEDVQEEKTPSLTNNAAHELGKKRASLTFGTRTITLPTIQDGDETDVSDYGEAFFLDEASCAVKSGGTNAHCAGKTTQAACDDATTSGGGEDDANACVFTAADSKDSRKIFSDQGLFTVAEADETSWKDLLDGYDHRFAVKYENIGNGAGEGNGAASSGDHGIIADLVQKAKCAKTDGSAVDGWDGTEEDCEGTATGNIFTAGDTEADPIVAATCKYSSGDDVVDWVAGTNTEEECTGVTGNTYIDAEERGKEGSAETLTAKLAAIIAGSDVIRPTLYGQTRTNYVIAQDLDKGTCAVASDGTNTHCAAATTRDECDDATGNGGGGDDANACVFTLTGASTNSVEFRREKEQISLQLGQTDELGDGKVEYKGADADSRETVLFDGKDEPWDAALGSAQISEEGDCTYCNQDRDINTDVDAVLKLTANQCTAEGGDNAACAAAHADADACAAASVEGGVQCKFTKGGPNPTKVGDKFEFFKALDEDGATVEQLFDGADRAVTTCGVGECSGVASDCVSQTTALTCAAASQGTCRGSVIKTPATCKVSDAADAVDVEGWVAESGTEASCEGTATGHIFTAADTEADPAVDATCKDDDGTDVEDWDDGTEVGCTGVTGNTYTAAVIAASASCDTAANAVLIQSECTAKQDEDGTTCVWTETKSCSFVEDLNAAWCASSTGGQAACKDNDGADVDGWDGTEASCEGTATNHIFTAANTDAGSAATCKVSEAADAADVEGWVAGTNTKEDCTGLTGNTYTAPVAFQCKDQSVTYSLTVGKLDEDTRVHDTIVITKTYGDPQDVQTADEPQVDNEDQVYILAGSVPTGTIQRTAQYDDSRSINAIDFDLQDASARPYSATQTSEKVAYQAAYREPCTGELTPIDHTIDHCVVYTERQVETQDAERKDENSAAFASFSEHSLQRARNHIEFVVPASDDEFGLKFDNTLQIVATSSAVPVADVGDCALALGAVEGSCGQVASGVPQSECDSGNCVWTESTYSTTISFVADRATAEGHAEGGCWLEGEGANTGSRARCVLTDFKDVHFDSGQTLKNDAVCDSAGTDSAVVDCPVISLALHQSFKVPNHGLAALGDCALASDALDGDTCADAASGVAASACTADNCAWTKTASISPFSVVESKQQECGVSPPAAYSHEIGQTSITILVDGSDGFKDMYNNRFVVETLKKTDDGYAADYTQVGVAAEDNSDDAVGANGEYVTTLELADQPDKLQGQMDLLRLEITLEGDEVAASEVTDLDGKVGFRLRNKQVSQYTLVNCASMGLNSNHDGCEQLYLFNKAEHSNKAADLAVNPVATDSARNLIKFKIIIDDNSGNGLDPCANDLLGTTAFGTRGIEIGVTRLTRESAGDSWTIAGQEHTYVIPIQCHTESTIAAVDTDRDITEVADATAWHKKLLTIPLTGSSIDVEDTVVIKQNSAMSEDIEGEIEKNGAPKVELLLNYDPTTSCADISGVSVLRRPAGTTGDSDVAILNEDGSAFTYDLECPENLFAVQGIEADAVHPLRKAPSLIRYGDIFKLENAKIQGRTGSAIGAELTLSKATLEDDTPVSGTGQEIVFYGGASTFTIPQIELGTCVVTSGGTNADCTAATTRTACDAATTSGGGGDAANACVFTHTDSVEGSSDLTFQILKGDGNDKITCRFITIELTSDTTSSGQRKSFKFDVPCPRTKFTTARDDILKLDFDVTAVSFGQISSSIRIPADPADQPGVTSVAALGTCNSATNQITVAEEISSGTCVAKDTGNADHVTACAQNSDFSLCEGHLVGESSICEFVAAFPDTSEYNYGECRVKTDGTNTDCDAATASGGGEDLDANACVFTTSVTAADINACSLTTGAENILDDVFDGALVASDVMRLFDHCGGEKTMTPNSAADGIFAGSEVLEATVKVARSYSHTHAVTHADIEVDYFCEETPIRIQALAKQDKSAIITVASSQDMDFEVQIDKLEYEACDLDNTDETSDDGLRLTTTIDMYNKFTGSVTYSQNVQTFYRSASSSGGHVAGDYSYFNSDGVTLLADPQTAGDSSLVVKGKCQDPSADDFDESMHTILYTMYVEINDVVYFAQASVAVQISKPQDEQQQGLTFDVNDLSIAIDCASSGTDFTDGQCLTSTGDEFASDGSTDIMDLPSDFNIRATISVTGDELSAFDHTFGAPKVRSANDVAGLESASFSEISGLESSFQATTSSLQDLVNGDNSVVKLAVAEFADKAIEIQWTVTRVEKARRLRQLLTVSYRLGADGSVDKSTTLSIAPAIRESGEQPAQTQVEEQTFTYESQGVTQHTTTKTTTTKEDDGSSVVKQETSTSYVHPDDPASDYTENTTTVTKTDGEDPLSDSPDHTAAWFGAIAGGVSAIGVLILAIIFAVKNSGGDKAAVALAPGSDQLLWNRNRFAPGDF